MINCISYLYYLCNDNKVDQHDHRKTYHVKQGFTPVFIDVFTKRSYLSLHLSATFCLECIHFNSRGLWLLLLLLSFTLLVETSRGCVCGAANVLLSVNSYEIVQFIECTSNLHYHLKCAVNNRFSSKSSFCVFMC